MNLHFQFLFHWLSFSATFKKLQHWIFFPLLFFLISKVKPDNLVMILFFFSLGTGLCPAGTSSFRISKFHLWFHRGVAQWLDIALYKAMQRIEKAAELDNLKPVDATVKYSSSAVDTLAIFYQVVFGNIILI